MSGWTAVVIAWPDPAGGPMNSRLPTYLHPVAGRPLIWHAVHALAQHEPRPQEVVVLAFGLTPELFDGLPTAVRVEQPGTDPFVSGSEPERVVIVHGATYLESGPLRRLLASRTGSWLAGGPETVAAITVDMDEAKEILQDFQPPSAGSGIVEAAERVEGGGSLTVRSRSDLAVVQRRIRDHLVTALMEAGVSFLLPESVMVDVDVRVGRDSIIYPGVVLEGQTTVGEETVLGPGCRVINSWVGSGVEMKGWNYVANTSVRNRAILEPYVRRGFD